MRIRHRIGAPMGSNALSPVGKTAAVRGGLTLAVVWITAWLTAGAVLAQPTQDEFFQSMGRSIERSGFESIDAGKVLAVLLAAAGLALVGLLIVKWRNRPVQRRNLNHSGKLIRELIRSGAISSSDMKKLTAAAEKRGIPNPLLLALCPSLLKQPPPGTSSKHQIPDKLHAENSI